jgi:argininosuccinate lyase
MPTQTLWGGRFKEPLAEIALKFSSSIEFDKILYEEDIAGSIAHVEMLAACKVLTASEMRRIRTALKSIQKEIETGKFELTADYEDVHMAIEQRLIQKIGALGGKLHTARSRNDQIALDERLFLMSRWFPSFYPADLQHRALRRFLGQPNCSSLTGQEPCRIRSCNPTSKDYNQT